VFNQWRGRIMLTAEWGQIASTGIKKKKKCVFEKFEGEKIKLHPQKKFMGSIMKVFVF
jgi:hypothetical protein